MKEGWRRGERGRGGGVKEEEEEEEEVKLHSTID